MNNTKKISPVWNEYEWEIFRNTVEERVPFLISAYELMYHCGLRVNEVLALSADDIDFNSNTILVDKSLSKVSKRIYLDDGSKLDYISFEPIPYKTVPRIITIPKDILPILKITVEVSLLVARPRIFARFENGIYRFFRECATNCGIPDSKSKNPHILRRTYRFRNGGR